MSDGLLADYGLDLDEIEVPSFDIPDGAYEFTVGDVFIKEGSTNNPDKSWVIFEYLVGDNGARFSELYELPKDAANPTEDEKKRLGRYKSRVVSLGFSADQVNSVTRDDLVGIQGTFQLRTTPGKKQGTFFQNIRNLRLADDGSNEFSGASAPEAPAAEKPAAAPRKAPASKPATAVDNPFAKKS